ncbi:MAG: 50S ribosomal protein L32e [Candidatus Pacearchaeota archaeon]|nr:50S ribosomal protein L32e [Candidatus Pacearchaeota archaeon]
MPKFLRHTSHKYSKLGVRRKKKQIWRRPTGRDNKMREQRRGHPPIVSIGYSNNKKTRGKIMEKTPVMVRNVSQIEKIQKNQIAILGKVGKKKKIEMAKKAKELKIDTYKFNPEKFLKLNEKNDKKVEVKDKDAKNKEKENKK